MSGNRHSGMELCTLGPKRPATPGKPISPESPCRESRTRWYEWSLDKDTASHLCQMLVSPGVEWTGTCALSEEQAEPSSQSHSDALYSGAPVPGPYGED